MQKMCELLNEAKLEERKSTQPATSQSSIALGDDVYAQVLGKDRFGRIRGIGTGVHIKKVTIYPTGESHSQLREENLRLTEIVKELTEKVKDVELLVHQKNENQQPSTSKCVASSTTIFEPQNAQMQGRKIKLLDMEGEEVASGVVMSEDKEKVVMGKILGDAYCEVSVNFVAKPNAPLIVKDGERMRMRDAIGSHIVWLKDYVQLDPQL